MKMTMDERAKQVMRKAAVNAAEIPPLRPVPTAVQLGT